MDKFPLKNRDVNIFISLHPDDKGIVLPILEQVRAAGWHNIDIPELQAGQKSILESIQQSGMVVTFLSKAYVQDQRLMLEEFAYAATVVQRPFIPVWVDNLADIQQDYQNMECDRQLLSALEMLTAKYSCTAIEKLIAELEQFTPDNIPYTPSTPQICDKPCEAYEGDEPYIFISYAHDDAIQVYPKIKELYESGWDLWYDEGIRVTERYLPVIADHVKRCSVFVLMLTNRCLERPFVMNYELEYARQRGVPIIPVLLEELTPQLWSKENAARLLKTAISQDALLEHISSVDLENHGTRTAVPPAIKHNVVYDVNLPPEMTGFKILVQGDEITITRYIGNDREVIIPSTIASADGNMTFRVTAIGDYAFTGGGRGFSGMMLKFSMMSAGVFNKTKANKQSLKKCKLLTSISIPDSITSIGKGAFSGCKSLTNIIIPNSVTSIGEHTFSGCKSLKNVIIPDSITSIDDDTFMACETLTNIVLPDVVTSIGDSAFFNCASLSEITIPDGVKSIANAAFSGCNSLTNITLPNSVTNIGEKVFERCGSLKNVTLPNNAEINAQIFYACPHLDAVFSADKATLFCGPQNWNSAKPYSIPDGVTKIMRRAFVSFSFLAKIFAQIVYKQKISNCRLPENVIIPDSFTEISAGAFENSWKLKNITIPSSVINIGEDAFHNCKSLKKIIIPNSVINIGERAFSGCKSLKKVVIPNSVTNIGDEAFSKCKSVKSIIIPSSVTSIGVDAFSECKSLASITIPDSITSIGEGAFSGCKLLKNVIIPDSVTSISEDAFSGCKALKNIIIPQSAISIGERAFMRCKALKNITIPDSVVSIDDRAFENCVSLSKIIIPDSVTSIGEEAFRGCKSLTRVIIPDSVTHIGYRAFDGTPVELTIPERMPIDVSQETKSEKPKSKTQKVEKIIPKKLIPQSHETPHAYVCCAKWDIEQITTLLTELYWEGFNFYYSTTTVEQEIDDSQCVLAFFSDKTAESEQAMSKLKYAVQHDTSRIIQVFLGDCTAWPNEIKDKLHDRQAIMQSRCSEQEFSGRIRDSLRKFECNIGHPRGFDVQKMNKTVEIVKFYPTDFPRVIIPKTFFNPPLPVSTIGATAFLDCESLIEVTIPCGVTCIGGDKFSGGAFFGCESLKNVHIPDSVLSIGANAFTGCEKLTSIIIPESVTSIGNNAFSSCNSLLNINIPGSITNIGDSVFSMCEKLTSVIISEGITSIGDSAFSFCKSLENVNIPNSVTNIGNGAFSSCESLTHITIPNSVKEIGNGAFNFCASLKSIVFFNKETTIRGDDTFDYCRLLTIYTPVGSKTWKYAEKHNIKHGDYKEAIEYFNKTIETYRQEYPKDSKGLLELLDTLLKLQIEVYGEESKTVATTYNSIGLAHSKMKNFEKALEYYQKALAIREKVVGLEHSATATSYNNIGSVYSKMGNYEKALKFYQKALAIREKVLGKEHPDTVKTLQRMTDIDKLIEEKQ
ncbi:hypothetical protein FACS1894199_01340 [Bacteroidia bacterium]|nr:hypothetical protein FACS1894199_01340 [Bacteroidia bacterium]